jgi:hypothetical protein
MPRSQPKAGYVAPILVEFVQPVMKCSTVLAGVIHERFYWHPAKPGGAAERDFVFAEQVERDQFGGFQRNVTSLVELCRRDEIGWQLNVDRRHIVPESQEYQCRGRHGLYERVLYEHSWRKFEALSEPFRLLLTDCPFAGENLGNA